MNESDSIANLMKRWESFADLGQEATPEALSTDPAVRETLRQEIERLKKARVALGVELTCEAPASPINALGFLPPGKEPGELARLGPFRVLRILGEGGMGMVLEAEEITLGRKVALKVLRPEVAASSVARQRFARETKAVAAISHDHVIPIYHVGEDGGVPFFAMPLLRGQSLADRLDNAPGPLPIPEILKIGRQIAEGLEAAHRMGLIHRDIKPGNVWLESTDVQPLRVKLLDFGLALSEGQTQNLTRTGMVVGTPAYMSPEQARGKEVDGRSDLFSLGCILYEMSTQRRAFTGDDALAILASLAADTPTDPHQLNPEMPRDLSLGIMKLLEKRPSERPQSAREVIDFLSAWEAYYSQGMPAQPVTQPPSMEPALRALEPPMPMGPILWFLAIVLAAMALFVMFPRLTDDLADFVRSLAGEKAGGGGVQNTGKALHP